jgi:hypothetical protein
MDDQWTHCYSWTFPLITTLGCIVVLVLLAHRLNKWLFSERRVAPRGDGKRGKVLAAIAAIEAGAARRAATPSEQVQAPPAADTQRDERYQRKNDDITRDPE